MLLDLAFRAALFCAGSRRLVATIYRLKAWRCLRALAAAVSAFRLPSAYRTRKKCPHDALFPPLSY